MKCSVVYLAKSSSGFVFLVRNLKKQKTYAVVYFGARAQGESLPFCRYYTEQSSESLFVNYFAITNSFNFEVSGGGAARAQRVAICTLPEFRLSLEYLFAQPGGAGGSGIKEKGFMVRNLLKTLMLIHNKQVYHGQLSPSVILNAQGHFVFLDFETHPKKTPAMELRAWEREECNYTYAHRESLRGDARYFSPAKRAALVAQGAHFALLEDGLSRLAVAREGSDVSVAHDPYKSDIYALGVVILQYLCWL